MAEALFWLQKLAAESPIPAEIGAKARHLALLCAAGLPVPEGFVLAGPALAAARLASGGSSAAADVWDQVLAEAARLGGPLVVRSSSAVEDLPEGAAPGLFSSRLDIWPDDLAQAVTAVVASADGPGVRAYLERRGLGRTAPHLAVIVQRQVGAGGARGVLYTRAPGQTEQDEVWIEAARSDGLASTAVVRRDGGEVLTRDQDFPLSAGRLAALVRLGLAAEKAIGAGSRPGADVEWVAEPPGQDDAARAKTAGGAGGSLVAPPAHCGIWLVQARPIRPASAAAATSEGGLAFSRGDPDTVWRWDASHNPDPLTPAQIGLVDVVADIATAPMRVVDGYLYVASSAKTDGPAPASVPAPPGRPPPTAGEIQTLFEDVRGAILAALEPVERTEPPDLDRALDAYRAVYEAYMVRLAPMLERARSRVEELGGPPVARTETAVGRAARSGDREALAALAPVWDVAAATFGERSEPAAWAQADRDRTLASASAPAAADLVTTVRTVSEADDLLFFRAQRAVRRALLALASAWHLSPPDDIFYLPLADVRARAESGTAMDPAAAHRLAETARAAREAQRRGTPPLAFRNGRSVALAGAPAGLDFWRGRSAGPGTARGPVLRVEDLGHLGAEPRAHVIVAQAVTPAALIQLAGAAALVCEQGGVLDHAAALARELSLPCVVGCAGAWRSLAAGDEVLVDGDAGLVVRLSGPG